MVDGFVSEEFQVEDVEEFGEYEAVVVADGSIAGKREMVDCFVLGESETQIEDGKEVGENEVEVFGENEVVVASEVIEFEEFALTLRRSRVLALALMRAALRVFWAFGLGYALMMDVAVKVRALQAVGRGWDEVRWLITSSSAWFPRVVVG